MLITGRERTSQAGEKDVGRVVEHYGLSDRLRDWILTGPAQIKFLVVTP
jgi:hypothetical protein